MSERDDHDLVERFHALRREDAAAARPFAALVAAARARRATPRRRSLGIAVAALAAALIGAVLLTRHDGQPAGIGVAAVRWRAPTDFLLELPGNQLLRTVPELGRMRLPRAHFTTIDSNRRTP